MSAQTIGQVVIFKSPNDNDKERGDAYSDILSSAGFQVLGVPVLDFEFINLDQLSEKLKNFREYSGIIFSSPRCVKGCTLAADAEILSQWGNHRNFAVGEATGKIAEEIGLIVSGTETGNANALADLIGKDEYDKPFLYPKGSLTNNTFKDKLKSLNVVVDDVIIYKTIPHKNLRENVSSLTNKLVEPIYFLYFSPSGVNFTLPLLKEMNFDISNVRFVAIGSTTEKSLAENGLIVFRTVSKPTPPATLEALLSGT